MLFAVQVCGYAVGLPLELLVIAALLHGGYKQYPFVFVYTIALFLTTTIEVPLSLAYNFRTPQALHWYPFYYWLDERILQTLMFLVVISLIFLAAANVRPRRIVLISVVSGTLLFAGVSFLVHYNPAQVVGRWMTPLTRDLNFCATILDLGLWTILMRPGRKDYRLLMLSGGLGIQFTGQAIGQALRNIGQSLQSRSPSLVAAGGILIMLTDLMFLYIWWQTFRGAHHSEERTAAS